MGLTAMQAQTNATQKRTVSMLLFFDTKTKPQDDFFRFVNGTWLDQI
jgi:predicted metalloendopeptidase